MCTDLALGDEFGGTNNGVVGYECDGCLTDANGKPTGADGTPEGFVVVAQAFSPSGGPGSQWYAQNE
eukprot:SAG31_NODE_2705_length_5215_cov_9.452502_4_plen_67_part_00